MTTAHQKTLTGSILNGAWRFALVSIAGFSVWALAGKWFHAHGGEVALYAASTVVFVSVAGLLMHPLIRGPRPLARFYRIFVPAFLAYGVVWSVFWFLLRFGAGEWLGSLIGGVCFVTVCGWRFGKCGRFRLLRRSFSSRIRLGTSQGAS